MKQLNQVIFSIFFTFSILFFAPSIASTPEGACRASVKEIVHDSACKYRCGRFCCSNLA